MKIREKWNDLICFIFEHRWLELESKFLKDALKGKYDITLDLRYRYCYRCGLLEQNCGNNFDAVYDRGKIHLEYLPWTTEGTGLPWPPNHPLLEWCTSVKYFFIRLWEWPGDTYREIKYGIQRWSRGWNDRDVWNLNDHLAKIISETVEHLRIHTHSYPSGLDPNDRAVATPDERHNEDVKKWDNILKTISEGFNIASRLGDDLIPYDPDPIKQQRSKEFEDEMVKKYGEDSRQRMITLEENVLMEQAFVYFKIYFFHLWD